MSNETRSSDVSKKGTCLRGIESDYEVKNFCDVKSYKDEDDQGGQYKFMPRLIWMCVGFVYDKKV